MTDYELVRKLGGYIWPRGDGTEERGVRRRVRLAMGLMVGSKVINTTVPFIFSHAVDSLNSPETLMPGVVIGTLASYGVARAAALGCG